MADACNMLSKLHSTLSFCTQSVEDTFHLCNTIQPLRKPNFPHNLSPAPLTIPTERPQTTTISLSNTHNLQKPLKKPVSLSTQDAHLHLREKVLYLESIGVDTVRLISDYRPISSASILDMKSVVGFLESIGILLSDLDRIFGMCPEILISSVSKDLLPVITFLLREVNVLGSNIRKVIIRRPRLLACSVEKQLRPTLYYLQSIGIEEVHKYTSLLSCSVEQKFLPRIQYFREVGFSRKDVEVMVRRYPQLFCYSIKGNFEPKLHYFVENMRRDLDELKEFPQYFSFSLENRIKPRHMLLLENHIYLPLPVILKPNDSQFHRRIEVCIGSSQPLKGSPLWSSGFTENVDISPNSIVCKENTKMLQCV
ncbi:hypothetical protein AMTRI_Chr11g95560 [Amborella trichopoda]|uniref:Uncharacterized protein n=1 Tax=Amborella trichopoda TaxID=13333 RepID=U5D736_AMBTC|nr:transcription termination factor MTEF1, chloroplastic [Amborella trichopoda]ERN16168.1 hypothetical protein AMTR_s00030p00229610 [Amborella trichopoda]|eukprot:XP_006854701.1 transcription termination factor MTEF1, chloroplastic [Amborella trichopoda]